MLYDKIIHFIQSIGTANLAIILMAFYLFLPKIWLILPEDKRTKITNIIFGLIDNKLGTSLNKKEDPIDKIAIELINRSSKLSDDYVEFLKQQPDKIESMQRQINELLPLKSAQKELLNNLKEQEHKISSQDRTIKEMGETIQDIIKQRDDAIATAKQYAKQIKELEKKHTEEISCYTKRVEVLEKQLDEMQSKWNIVYSGIQSIIGLSNEDIDSFIDAVNKLGRDLGISNG